MIEPIVKHRCAMGRMPFDIKDNALSQLPYLNQPFDLFCAEAKEAGFDIEHWNYDGASLRDHIHTLRVRPVKTIVVVTKGGYVHQIL